MIRFKRQQPVNCEREVGEEVGGGSGGAGGCLPPGTSSHIDLHLQPHASSDKQHDTNYSLFTPFNLHWAPLLLPFPFHSSPFEARRHRKWVNRQQCQLFADVCKVRM